MRPLPRIHRCFLLLALVGTGWMARPATAQLLSPGDLAIAGVNMDDPNEISFVALVDIPAGVELRFTDNGWTATGTFRDEEDTMIYVTPVPIPRGNVVVLNGTDGRVPGLATAGDQLFAYQVAGDGTIRFIYGLNNTPAGGWQDDATTDQETTLPAQLLDGFTAVSLPHCDNVIYTGISTGRQAEILIHMANPAGWLCNDANHFKLGSHPFSVTGVFNTLPVFTQALPDTTIRAGETLDFRYQAADPDGQVILFTGLSLPGGAVVVPTTGTLRWTPGANQLGDHTIRVQASDGIGSSTTTATITVASGVAVERPGDPGREGRVYVYPNPSRGQVTVQHPPNATLRVVDTLGRVVFVRALSGDRTQLSTAAWARGLYILQIQSRTGLDMTTLLIP